MEGPKQLSISQFSYILPEEKIALYPLPQRDAARLLVYKGGQIEESNFVNLVQYLPKKALLIFNNTRVIPARLLFQKSTGSIIEIFILEPVNTTEVSVALQQSGTVEYLCLVKGVAKWKGGILEKSINVNGNTLTLKAELIEKKTDAFHIRLSWRPATLSFAEVLQLFGEMPIPPYLRRPAELSDAERYQTIYASQQGSVAAPTAGLHFTEAVMQSLQANDIATAYTTLHVGAGTFKPVKAETLAGHEMHAEWISIEKNVVEKLLLHDTIIPVGTTSLRTLETCYWLGLKTIANPQISQQALYITQWEVYQKIWPDEIPFSEALQALIRWMDNNGLSQFITHTQILIAPGYTFRICKGLITNFHQPQSTLLLLIAALIGDDWKRVYDYALDNNFRFLSYGDSSFLMNSE
jgi:S-adenosylmethionine:tRNA ribosyltransferase-isomerase